MAVYNYLDIHLHISSVHCSTPADTLEQPRKYGALEVLIWDEDE